MSRVTRAALIREAAHLKSEHGENPEYDRALVELVTFVTGGTAADLPATAREIGIVEHPDGLWYARANKEG